MKTMLLTDGSKLYYHEILKDTGTFYHVRTNEYPKLAVEKSTIKTLNYKSRRVRL